MNTSAFHFFTKVLPSFDPNKRTVVLGKNSFTMSTSSQSLQEREEITNNNNIQNKYHLLSDEFDFAAWNTPPKLVSLDPKVIKREGLIIDLESQLVKKHVLAVEDKLEQLKYTVEQLKLMTLAEYVKDILPGTDIQKVYDKEASNAIRLQLKNRKYQNCISLDGFIQEGQATCRHEAPFVAMLVAGLIKNGKLTKGSVRQYSSPDVNAQSAFVFIIYATKDGKGLYLIDPSNPHQTVYNLATRLERTLALANYAERGYEGVLDRYLAKKNLLKPDEQASIPEELLFSIEDETQFIQNGYTDPISKCIMKCPVRIEGEHLSHVFDRDVLIEMWKHKTINPLTNKLCQGIMIPAPDVRGRIIRLISDIKGTNLIEGQAVNIPKDHFQKKSEQRKKMVEQGVSELMSKSEQDQQPIPSMDVEKKKKTKKHTHLMFKLDEQQQNPEKQDEQKTSDKEFSI